MWPSISPWNIWDLPFGMWLQFAAEADAYDKAMREAQRVK